MRVLAAVVTEDDGIEHEEQFGITVGISGALDEFSANARGMTVEDRAGDHRIISAITHECGH
jgi:hypothetical protein